MCLSDVKECPECGGKMRSHIVFKNKRFTEERPFSEIDKPISTRVLRCEKCGFSEEVKTEADREHALDACKYSMQNLFACSKMLAEMPPMVGVEVTLRDFSTRLDEKVQKVYIDGCVLAEIDPEALKKTAELNSELQFALKALMKLRKWIPVEEGMPDSEFAQHTLKFPNEECVEVVVLIKGSSVATTLYYNGKCFEDEYGLSTYNVTHWMPMPEPPEVQYERFDCF